MTTTENPYASPETTGPVPPAPDGLRVGGLPTRLSQIGLILAGAVALFAAVADLRLCLLARKALDATAVTDAQWEAAYRWVVIGEYTFLALFYLAGIPFILWFHRAYRNLGALRVADLRYSTGWVRS